MADERMLVVELRIKGTSSDDSSGNEEEGMTTALTPKGENKDKNKKQNTKLAIMSYAFSSTLNKAREDINNSINRYFNLSENYIAQNYYNNVKTSIGKASSLITTLKVGGSIGGVAGMAVGLGMWGVGQYLQYSARMSSYYSGLNATNYGTAFGQERAGLYDNGRGTEN